MKKTENNQLMQQLLEINERLGMLVVHNVMFNAPDDLEEIEDSESLIEQDCQTDECDDCTTEEQDEDVEQTEDEETEPTTPEEVIAAIQARLDFLEAIATSQLECDEDSQEELEAQ